MNIEFATIDFETTGFSPSRNRIIEIGVVRTDSSGKVLQEFQSLIQPNQDVGRTDIHGISPTDLVKAPVFSEILLELSRVLNGAILVAHNAKFDFSFLEHELERANATFREIDGFCTLELVYQVLPNGSRKLSHCCEHFGIPLGTLHSALDDARMASQLLSKVLEGANINGLPEPFEMSPPNIPQKQPHPRSSNRAQRQSQSHTINELKNRMPAKPAKGSVSASTVSQYLNLLDEVLQDEKLDIHEIKALEELAALLNLDPDQRSLLHSTFIYNLCHAAKIDHVVTKDERRKIGAAADLLMVSDWEGILDGDQKTLSPINAGEGSILHGLRVCFTGTMSRTREDCHYLAKQHGLIVQESVTKKLDILVVADQNTESTKAKKARENSVRIIKEDAFFDLLLS